MKTVMKYSSMWTLVVALAAIWHVSSQAQSFEYEGSEYTIIDGESKTVCLTHAANNGMGMLRIPKTVTCDDEHYTVVEIGENACANCGSRWTSIPATVTRIDRYALRGTSGTLIFEEDDDPNVETASIIDVHALQFGFFWSLFCVGDEDTPVTVSTFKRVYIGRPIQFFVDEEQDGIYENELKYFYLMVNQKGVDEVMVGNNVTNFSNIFFGSDMGANYCTIKKLYLFNRKTIVDYPSNLFVSGDILYDPFEFTKLYVPTSMKGQYAASWNWSRFKTINEFTPTASGLFDLNADGNINVSDVSTLYIAMLAENQENLVGDLNGDGYCNAGDISELYNIILNGDSRWWVNFITNKGKTFSDENGVMYQTIEEDEAAVIRFPQEAKSVVIPEEVENDNVTYRVTRIAQYAANDIVERLVIPASVDSIEPHGLSYCLKLKDLSFLGSDEAKPLRIGPNQFHEIISSSEMEHCSTPWTNHLESHDHLQLKTLYLDRDIQRNAAELTNRYHKMLIFHQIDMDSIVIGEHVTDISLAFGAGGNGISAIRVKDIELHAPAPSTLLHTMVGESSVGDYTFFHGQFLYREYPQQGTPDVDFFSNYQSTTLHVPERFIGSYQAAFPWNKFENVELIEEDLPKFQDENMIQYEVIAKNNVRVLKFPETAEVVIPEQVTYANKTYTVSQIRKYASNDVVERLVIPATIDSIEPYGLAFSLNLKDLAILGSDEAKTLRIGPNQFHEIQNDNEFYLCTANNASPYDGHDHLQLKSLYIDRDINRYHCGRLLSHQIDMDKIVFGEHVSDISNIIGYNGYLTPSGISADGVAEGVSAIRVDTIEFRSALPPKHSWFSTYKYGVYNIYNLNFFEGEFNYTEPGTSELKQDYYSNYQSTKLIVPKGATEAYSADFPWNKFEQVEEADE